MSFSFISCVPALAVAGAGPAVPMARLARLAAAAVGLLKELLM
jgi:hypothetical protein